MPSSGTDTRYHELTGSEIIKAIDAFEQSYLERASATVPQPDYVRGIALDRRPMRGDMGNRPLLTGWWCDPEASEPLVVLPNPWSDRDAVALYARYCWDMTYSLLEELARVLNSAHATDHPVEYWELLFVRWMLSAVAATVDRRLFCTTAHSLVSDAPFLTSQPLPAPDTLLDGLALWRNDRPNRWLIGQIARTLGYPVAEVPEAQSAVHGGEIRSSYVLRRRDLALSVLLQPQAGFEYLAYRIVKPALSLRTGRRVTLLGQFRLHLPAWDVVRLARLVRGLRLAPYDPSARQWLDESVPADISKRALLTTLTARDDRERVFIALLPHILPRSLLECYPRLVKESARRYGPPSHILHGNYSDHEVSNEFVARSKIAGKSVAFNQHGGSYCQLKVNLGEAVETERADSPFFSWGSCASAQVEPLPSPYIQRLRDSHRGGELVVLVEYVRPVDAYLYLFASGPLANEAYAAHLPLALLVEAAESVRSHVVLKRFPGSESMPRHPTLEALTPPPRRLRALPGVEWIRSARVAVVAYPDTPFIEAMTIGAPVIGLWDTSIWQMKEEASPYFEELERVGVVYSSPTAAAAQLERIYHAPDLWWTSPAVSRARQRFLARFAITEKWLGKWARSLARLDADGGQR